MNKEKQIITIAKAYLGFEDFDWLLWCAGESCLPWEGRRLHGAKRYDNIWHQVPDFLNDLNAMNSAILFTMNSRELRNKYSNELCVVVARTTQIGNSSFWMENATAAQCAEALLKTIDKWE